MSKLPITGEYPPDWPVINAAVCETVGHRCIRCGHPYKKGVHGSGQWTACDDKCTHPGPIAFWLDMEGSRVPIVSTTTVQDALIAARERDVEVVAEWRILTVHHLDGNKANCSWWNLWALCQRCHLTIQSRVNPEVPYFLEHDEWAKPYIAGFYAKKYEGREITREEAAARMHELLAYERLA